MELSTPPVDGERSPHRLSAGAERRRRRTSRQESGSQRPSLPETGPESFSPFDGTYDDVVGVDHDQDDHLDHNNIIKRLHALHPPFNGAAEWLKTVPVELVEAWLAYLETMDGAARDTIRNEVAFIRKQVASGRRPPPTAGPKERCCPTCGRAHFGDRGECLVCNGLVTI